MEELAMLCCHSGRVKLPLALMLRADGQGLAGGQGDVVATRLPNTGAVGCAPE